MIIIIKRVPLAQFGNYSHKHYYVDACTGNGIIINITL